MRRVLCGLLLAAAGCGDSALDQARALRGKKQPLEALKKYEEAIRTLPEQSGEIVKEADALVGELLPEVVQLYGKGRYQEVVSRTARMLAVRTTQPEAYLYDGLSRIAARPLDPHQIDLALSSINRHLRLAGQLGEQMTYPRYLLQAIGARAAGGADRKAAARALARFGKDVASAFATLEDRGYLMRTLLYRKIARAAAGQGPPEAQARALFRWLVRNHQLEFPGEIDLEAKPYDVLLRGYGFPDRLVWTTVELARQLDLLAVVRIDPIEGTKRYDFHVSVWTGKALLTFDPRRGVALEQPPGPGTVFLLAGEPRSYFPRMRIIEELLKQHLADAPRLFCRPDATIVLLAEQVQGRKLGPAERSKLVFPIAAKGKPSINLWSHPFGVDALYRDKAFNARITERRKVIDRYNEPRLLQLQGLPAEAAELYTRVQGQLDGAALRDVGFHLALCLQESGKPDQAAAALRQHLARNPKTPWRALLQLRLGECLAATGHAAEAQAAWKLVPGPRQAFVATLR